MSRGICPTSMLAVGILMAMSMVRMVVAAAVVAFYFQLKSSRLSPDTQQSLPVRHGVCGRQGWALNPKAV